jgi:hypothetical protein
VNGAMDGDKAVSTQQRHARNVRDPSRVLEQGPDRQRTPVWCSGGVSSISGASESRCTHDGSGGWKQQERQRDRHRSSPEAMGVHEGGFTNPIRGPPAAPRLRQEQNQGSDDAPNRIAATDDAPCACFAWMELNRWLRQARWLCTPIPLPCGKSLPAGRSAGTQSQALRVVTSTLQP